MEDLKLRKLNDDDIELFEKWVNQDYVLKWYEHPEAWIDEIQKRQNEFSWVNHFIVTYNNKDIGFCQYYDYKMSKEDWHGDITLDGTYSIDYMIGESEYLKRGFGTRIVSELISDIRSMTNAKRIIVLPEAENSASCNTLISAGFKYDEDNKLYLFCY